MRNYSRQREAILKVVRESRSHLTADEVYNAVRKEIPNISLGTVYRNLTLLQSEGDIVGVSVGDGSEHFDGDCSPHLHMHCRKCGKIHDLPIESDTLLEMAKAAGFQPEGCAYVVKGICAECQKN